MAACLATPSSVPLSFSPSYPFTVAVVGGGASGTLAAAHLLARATTPLRVALVERRLEVGRGVAYSATHPRHLLNVPAAKMSAWPDEPDHFLGWLRRGSMPEAAAGTFAPRRLYGSYLASVLADATRRAAPGVRLERHHGAVEAITASTAGATLALRSGAVLAADRVVLALGHGAMQQAVPPAVAASPRYAPDPWAPGALDGLAPDASVLFVGTGLTMVDGVLALAAAGHTGPILALSRRGLAPQAHRPSAPVLLGDRPSAAALSAHIRSAGTDWRGALDAVRPHSHALWQSLDLAGQRRFLRHLRPYWDVHRHRIAPESAEALDALRTTGQLAVRAGRLVGATPVAEGLDVHVRYRGETGETTVRVQRIVNCTGTSLACTEDDHPVLAGLYASGDAICHPLGLGLAVDDAGALVGADGEASRVLFAVGPLRAGHLWETTAIPEIRTQAAQIPAAVLESSLLSRSVP